MPNLDAFYPLTHFAEELTRTRPMVCISNPRRSGKSFLQQQMLDNLITTNEILNNLSWKEAHTMNRNPNAEDHATGLKKFFIIWCPGSVRPPVQTFDTAEEAWKVADGMATRHDPNKFFVMESLGCSEITKPVTRRTY